MNHTLISPSEAAAKCRLRPLIWFRLKAMLSMLALVGAICADLFESDAIHQIHRSLRWGTLDEDLRSDVTIAVSCNQGRSEGFVGTSGVSIKGLTETSLMYYQLLHETRQQIIRDTSCPAPPS